MAVIIPPIIYGLNTREKRLSIQLPTIVRYSLKHGYAGQVGKGLSVWGQVHVKDLARGYMTLLHWMEITPVPQVAENPYVFCENGQELSWGECSAEIGRILQKAGRINEAEPKTILAHSINKYKHFILRQSLLRKCYDTLFRRSKFIHSNSFRCIVSNRVVNLKGIHLLRF